jgi:hypothetical protein
MKQANPGLVLKQMQSQNLKTSEPGTLNRLTYIHIFFCPLLLLMGIVLTLCLII